MDDTERLVVLLEARVRDFEKNLEKASGTAGREFDRMRKGSRTATAAMEADMTRATSRMAQAMATVSTRVGAMATAFGTMATAGGAALIGFAAQARATAREIATIGDEAKKAGIGIKAFQELRYVADQNRVSIDALTDGIKEMNLRADEFIVTGSGSGAEAFKRLGLTADDLTKKLKDPSALFTEIIGKLGKMDRAAQIRIADEVFGGTGGEQFVQLIEQGANGIRRTIKEANDLGIVMDEQMIAKAAEVDRMFGMIASTVETKLKGAIVNAATALSDFMDGYREFQNQKTTTLDTELADIGKRRLENEKRIFELRDQQKAMEGTPKGARFAMQSENAIKLIEEENAALTEQEKKIVDVLKTRDTQAETAKKTADASKQLGDSLGYVAKNGGASGQVVDAYSKSVQSLKDRLKDQVSGLQLTVDYAGKSEGALAAARFQADAMADALQAAKAAGKDAVDPALAKYIAEQASQYGALTDKVEANTKAEEKRQDVLDKAKERAERIKTFEGDLAFERSIMALPEAEQEIRSTLHELDVDYSSFEGQRIAATIRTNDHLREMQEELRRTGEEAQEAFGSFVDGLIQGDNAFDSLMSSFGQFGRQMASQGFDKLFKTFTTTGSFSGIFNSAGSTAQSGSRAPDTLSQPLTALNDNLGKSASSALAVARQFEGLNEKADSKVLDGFLQANGNWKGMSVKDQAWCASFANAAIAKAGGQGTGSNFASSFLDWGKGTDQPKMGDIVVLRPQTKGSSGHVGFVVGSGDGKIQVFGGNQGNSAKVSNFSLKDVVGYRTSDSLGIDDMTKAVSDGTLDATKKVNSGAVPIPTQRPTTTEGGIDIDPTGKMDGLGNGMKTLGMGLGAFAQGYQSGSVGGGALGGLMAGLSTGNPVLAVGGAIIGAIGGAHPRSRLTKRDNLRRAA